MHHNYINDEGKLVRGIAADVHYISKKYGSLDNFGNAMINLGRSQAAKEFAKKATVSNPFADLTRFLFTPFTSILKH